MYTIRKITANPTVDYAAEELKKYLRMMMPYCGEIPISYDPAAADGFRLGLMADFDLDTSEAADVALDDILHIDTDEKGGIIAGSNPRSVLLAVYRYLTMNGCRWLFPGIDGEFVPMQDVVPTRYHKMADCRYRGQCNEGAEYQPNMIEAIEFTPKIGMNIFMIECFTPGYYNYYYNHRFNDTNREPEPVTRETLVQWKKQCEAEIAKRGLQFHDIGHGWTTRGLGIEPETKLTEEAWEARPEFAAAQPYLALCGGKRTVRHGNPWLTNFCMSNPEARRLATRNIVDYAQMSTNVDFLHVWLADDSNVHCECEECQKKSASDWYAIWLNEIDEELTRRNLDTHIVMISYYDTLFAPETVRFNNPGRFTILLAPITRTYTEGVAQTPVSTDTLPKYVRNQVKLPKENDVGIAFGKSWKQVCDVDVIVYEYHFWVNQVYEPAGIRFARIIHEDINGYKYHGFNGVIEDGSQRSFFPNGFPFYTYGQTLFDNSIDFEALKADYFSHAYGEDWKEVVAFLEKMTQCFDHKYIAGENSADPRVGTYYNPAQLPKLRKVKEYVAEFAPFVEAHKNMPYRSQTVAYRILRRYLEYLCGLAEILSIRCLGADREARERNEKFLQEFGRYELELERYYDQCIFGKAMQWRVLKEEESAVILAV